MGYEGKNKKILPGLNSRFRLWAKRLNTNFPVLSSRRTGVCKTAEVRFRE
jgi:hypothetical protein